HVRRFYDTVARIFESGHASGAVPDLSVVQFYYLLVSSASIFAMAPECRLLAGTDPLTPTMVDAQVDAIAALLTAATPPPTLPPTAVPPTAPGGRP
ncbi:MAG: hypothetical protein AAGA93_17880, partial [Actinomycetota bacterium]